MKKPYAFIRVAKCTGNISRVGYHNDRTRMPDNADKQLSYLNRTIVPHPSAENGGLKAKVDWVISEGYTGKRALRKDAVKAIELVLTGSHKPMTQIHEAGKLGHWIKANKDFLEERYGERNLVSLILHRDERTPHLHAIVVPLTEDGRLSAKEFLNGGKMLAKLQDDYAEAMAPFKLLRGERGSRARHIPPIPPNRLQAEIDARKHEAAHLAEELKKHGIKPPPAVPPAPPVGIIRIQKKQTPSRDAEYLVEERIKEGYTSKRKIRKDAVRMIDITLTGTQKQLKKLESEERIGEWVKANKAFLEQEYGKKNVVLFWLHKRPVSGDLCIKANVVPITRDGRLCAASFLEKKDAYKALHDRYARAMVPYGFQRCQEVSRVLERELEGKQARVNRLKTLHKGLEDTSVSPKLTEAGRKEAFRQEERTEEPKASSADQEPIPEAKTEGQETPKQAVETSPSSVPPAEEEPPPEAKTEGQETPKQAVETSPSSVPPAEEEPPPEAKIEGEETPKQAVETSPPPVPPAEQEPPPEAKTEEQETPKQAVETSPSSVPPAEEEAPPEAKAEEQETPKQAVETSPSSVPPAEEEAPPEANNQQKDTPAVERNVASAAGDERTDQASPPKQQKEIAKEETPRTSLGEGAKKLLKSGGKVLLKQGQSLRKGWKDYQNERKDTVAKKCLLRECTRQVVEDAGTWSDLHKDIQERVRSAPQGVPNAEIDVQTKRGEKGEITAVKVEMTSEMKSYKVKIQGEELSESLQKRRRRSEIKEQEAERKKSMEVLYADVTTPVLDRGYAEGRTGDWDDFVAKTSREESAPFSFGGKMYSIKNIKYWRKKDDKGKYTYGVDCDLVCGEKARRISSCYTYPIPLFVRKMEENKERKAEEIKARDEKAKPERVKSVQQKMHDLLDKHSCEKRIEDMPTFTVEISKEKATCNVDGVPYHIKGIRLLELVKNEQGKPFFKVAYEAVGHGERTAFIDAAPFLEKLERNKELKAEEIEARDMKAMQEAPGQVIQLLEAFLDAHKARKIIANMEMLNEVLPMETIPYEVDGKPYEIKGIMLEPVGQGEQALELSYELLGSRRKERIDAKPIYEKLERNAKRKEELIAKYKKARKALTEKLSQTMDKLLIERRGEKRITDWKTFATEFSKLSPTCEVDGVSYTIKDIKLELVGNEGEEKTCKLNYRVGEQLLSLTMNTEFVLKKFEENKVLKSKEIKAEREAERSRGSSMSM